MLRSPASCCVLGASFAVLTLAPASAQTGRVVSFGTLPALGALSSYSAHYPPSAAGRIGAYGMTLPFHGAVPLVLPGFTSTGLVRIDLANVLVQGMWVLDATGSYTWTVPVPLVASFQGLVFDVQTLDVGATDFAWGDNSLRMTIGQGAIGQGHTMVPIRPGTFMMGSPEPVGGGAPYFNSAVEQPVHQVTIAQPFWIGRYEVTQAEYQAVMGGNPSTFQGPTLPVERVSWLNAVTFCSLLTASELAAGRVPAGYQYRLPTEAEWEYCYRAGTTLEFGYYAGLPCGSAHISYSQDSFRYCEPGYGGPQFSTATVGSYPANPWGLRDMAGNVAEWCLDSWDGTANYPTAAAMDPYVTVGAHQVVRGGSWGSSSENCRAADRGLAPPVVASQFIGFRIVLAPSLLP